MTSDHTRNPAPPPAARGRRYSIGVVIGAGLGGLAVGVLAVFAVTGPTWKVRVEFPPPPYPAPLSSAPLITFLPPQLTQSPPTVSVPSSAPGGLPAPPFPPPGPRP
jgi:hypothetical protein